MQWLAQVRTRAVGGGLISARTSFHRNESCYDRSIALWAAEVSTQLRKGDVSERLDRLIDINLPCGIALDAPSARRPKYILSIPKRRENDLLDHGIQNSPL
jgi:hypothetical protein